MKTKDAIAVCEILVKAKGIFRGDFHEEELDALTTILTKLKQYQELEAATEEGTEIYFGGPHYASVELCGDGLWRHKISTTNGNYDHPGMSLLEAFQAAKRAQEEGE